MERLLDLYPVVLTFFLIIGFFIALFWEFSIWRRRLKARGRYSYEAEIYRSSVVLTATAFLFLAADVTFYQFGAEISFARIRFVLGAFFTAAGLGLYFRLIGPHIFRVDYDQLSQTFSKGMKVLVFLALTLALMFTFVTMKGSQILAEFLFDKYAPCLLNG